jgi:predicted double-glycine peptidase
MARCAAEGGKHAGRRYRNVVRQHTDYSCGAAALATILRHAYHLQTDERR